MGYRDVDWQGLLAHTQHRPWPVPEAPWRVRMSWRTLLFAHFAVDAPTLAARLPPGLELDCFDGVAYVGIVPFVMDNVGYRELPTPRPWARFCELNVRTYVACDGKPGVWFFSLDAERRLAVEGARATFNLPYFNAATDCTVDGESVHYGSERTDRRIGPGRFDASWYPTSPPRAATPGTLEHFLTERYCLYSADRRGRLYRAEVQHAPWALRDAHLELRDNTVCDAHRLLLREPASGPLLHCVENLDVIGWTAQAC